MKCGLRKLQINKDRERGSMKKRIISLMIPVMALLTLTGCIRIDRGIEVKPNGKIGANVSYAFSESFVNYMFESKEEFFEKMQESEDDEDLDYEATEFTADGETWYGLNIRGDFDTPAEAAEALEANFDSSGEDDFSNDFEIEQSGFIRKTITVKMTSLDPDRDPKGAEGMKAFGVKDVFTIKVPSKIVETNGEIDSADPTRASWDVSAVDFGGEDTMEMSVTYMYMMPIIIGVGALAALIVGVILVVVAIIIIRKVAGNRGVKNIGE